MRCVPAFLLVAIATACGRIGFETDRGPTVDSNVGDSTPAADAPPSDGAIPMIACADENLGSMLGTAVATGSTNGRGDDDTACSGDGHDVTFGWFAPAAGTYRIGLCNSDYDTVLYVRDGACTGAVIACNDDACGGLAQLQSRVDLQLAAGQGIVIVVDGLIGEGNYELAITPL